MEVTYKKIKIKGNPVQVDSAIRDDKGRIISKQLDDKANISHEHMLSEITDYIAPTIPSKTSDLENDDNFATQTYVDNKVSSVYKLKGTVANYSSLPSENNVIGDVWNLTDTGANYVWDGSAWDKLGDTVDLSAYAKTTDLFSKNYDDLTNKPTIPTATSDLTNNSGFITSGDLPTLATVATSGSYTDLTNKPIIPTVPAISTNITADALDDTKTASPKAVKTYVDSALGDIETLLEAI